ATAGVGMLLSSLIAGPVVDIFSEKSPVEGQPPVVNWHYVFLVPVGITVLGALTFLVGFREKTKEQLDKEFGRDSAPPPDTAKAADWKPAQETDWTSGEPSERLPDLDQ